MQNAASPSTSRPAPSHQAGNRPLRVGTRGSPLALIQTRAFMTQISAFCSTRQTPRVFEEHVISVSGDAVLDRPLAELGGKGLFAKEIHEALLDRRVDFAVHSLKDLETELPPGIILACTLLREDARDVLLLPPAAGRNDAEQDGVPALASGGDPYACLARGAVIGTSSVRRQAQLLHARPDLRIALMRGNVQTRLRRLAEGACDASLLALAGLTRLGMADRASVVLEPGTMVPSAGQGIVGVTIRAGDTKLLELLSGIEDASAKRVATAERALLGSLDGSCRTPVAGHAVLLPGDRLSLTGLVARADGTFLLRRTLDGPGAEAARIGAELGASLRTDSPSDLFA